MSGKWLLAHVASIILGMGFGWCSVSVAQMGGGMGGGMPNVPGTAFGGVTDPSSMQAVEGLRVVPSVQVSERYDSNVFFAPKSQLGGLTPADFVTTVVPQVRGLYVDREKLVKVNATAGAVGSYYMNNTGLSYVGANGGAGLDMSDLLSQWRPGARWRVSDSYFYTPQPPAFLVGDQSGDQAHPLVAGFQATRAKTNSNNFNTMLEFPLTATINLTGSYTRSFIHYGTSQVPQAAALINQDAQAYTTGLLVQASGQDTVKIDFTASEFNMGGGGSFNARGGILGWSHTFTPTISFRATGGAQVLAGEVNGVRFSSTIAPVGSLAVLWRYSETSMALAYQSGITPSFQSRSATMLNHMVSFSITQNTPIRDLVGLLSVSYGVANEYGSHSGTALSWTTAGGTAGLLYRVTQKTFLTVNYGYQNVDNVFGGTHFAYDKHVAQISLAQAFY